MLISRRNVIQSVAAATLLPALKAERGAQLTHRQRIERLLRSQDLDRTPFSIWQHLGIERQGPEAFAKATLDYHTRYETDFIKVMSDLQYPKPAGAWWDLKVLDNPFPDQVRALELIRDGLPDKTYFVETIFTPWNVAEKLSSEQEVRRLKQEQPQKLLDALDVIAKSQANHAKRALQAGAAGIFFAIANADADVLPREDYLKFSQPFDRIVMDAARSAKFNILHIHGSKIYLDNFYSGWPAAAINYSVATTGLSLAQVKPHYAGILIGGVDEKSYRFLSVDDLRDEYKTALAQAGPRFIFAPGCTVPNETPPEELEHLKAIFA